MGSRRYFEQALARFTFDAGCGDAIRHLADCGYTAGQIVEKLTYPATTEQIRDTVREHFYNTGVLVKEEPGTAKIELETEFVREYDSYGKASFRKITKEHASGNIGWKELRFSPTSPKAFPDFIAEKISENGIENSYTSCDFITRESSSPAAFPELSQEQNDYLSDIFPENAAVWHRLTPRMTDIIKILYRNIHYSGTLYFLRTGEKITVV
jgi:hypothetical protein